MTPLRVLVVDDEPLARTRIRSLLAQEKDVEIVGECGNGRDAVSAIAEQHPDLVILDIQMPELDGFGVVREVGAERMPLVIFSTAYDEYALRAFEVHALDYVLKPVQRERFRVALARARKRLADAGSDALHDQLRQLVARMAPAASEPDRLAIKADGRVVFIQTRDIDWIEAVDNYARIHVGKQSHLVRDTLARLESRLPRERFLRIHRSTIVNVERVREIQPWFQGDFVLILSDGTKLNSGRSYRQRVQAFMKRAM